jgi:hypothetical protein
MKTILNISILTFLLVAASSHCFALMDIADVSKEQAKELGIGIRTNAAGPNEVSVWLEFVPHGVLKNFTRVDLEINAGKKRLVAAPLLASRPTLERVAVHFSADPAYLATSILTIVVVDGERTIIGYRLKVKDFIEHEKSR